MWFFGPNIKKLEKNGDVENLLKCLNHFSSNIRIEAFNALVKKISDKRIYNELKKMIDDKDSEVSANALLTFFQLGDDINLDKIYEMMKVASKKQKLDVLKILEEKYEPGNTEISKILILAVNDINIVVAEQAIKTIGILKNSHSIGYLARRLNEKSYNVRFLVIEALSQIGGDQVVDALTAGLLDKNQLVRNNAKAALQKIRTEKALKAINDMPFLELIKGMSDIETIRIETIQHIANQKIHAALGLLHKACLDKYKLVRIEALKALAVFGNKESIPAISFLLNDKYYDVRLEAVKALEHIPHHETLTALEMVMNDLNYSVKNEAKMAYDQLKKKING